MSAWTQLRDDLLPFRWLKKGGNREDWMRRLGMMLAVGTGAGAAGYGPMASLFPATAGAASGNPALLGTGSIGPVASGAEYSALLGGSNPTMAASIGMGDKFLNGIGGMSKNMGKAHAVSALLGGQEQQPMMPPPMPQQQVAINRLPTGYDPVELLKEEERRRMLGRHA